MKASVGLGVFLAVALASAQGTGEGPKKHTPRKAQVTNAPVSRSEARATFARAEQVFRKALGLPASAAQVSIPDGSEAVSREAVVAEMSRFYREFKGKVKLTPQAVAFEPGRLRIGSAQRANLESLIRMGAVAKFGPLATGPGNALTVPEFGDALGFFLARLAYMTHLPSSKWTPALRKEGS